MDIVSKLHEMEDEMENLKGKKALSGIERKRLEYLEEMFKPRHAKTCEVTCENCGS